MNDNYYQKYLKYKTKYLELKKLIGGGNNCNQKYINNDKMECGCKKFVPIIKPITTDTICANITTRKIRGVTREVACGHKYSDHK
jgi:hypothetical protein